MNDEMIEKILEEVAFERQFYEAIAETEDYDVIPFEVFGHDPLHARHEIERRTIEMQCDRNGTTVLYRISYGDYAVILCRDNPSRIGLVPETNPDGWQC